MADWRLDWDSGALGLGRFVTSPDATHGSLVFDFSWIVEKCA